MKWVVLLVGASVYITIAFVTYVLLRATSDGTSDVADLAGMAICWPLMLAFGVIFGVFKLLGLAADMVLEELRNLAGRM